MDRIERESRTKVFLPDNDLVWITADIIKEVKPGHYEIEIDDDEFKVSPGNSSKKVITMRDLCRKVDSLPLQNDGLTAAGVDDMTILNYLHEASILDNLRRRFKLSIPYTNTGDICIAVCHLYRVPIQRKYLFYCFMPHRSILTNGSTYIPRN